MEQILIVCAVLMPIAEWVQVTNKGQGYNIERQEGYVVLFLKVTESVPG